MPEDLIKAEIKGMKEVQAKMTQVARDMQGDLFRGAMSKATLLVTRDAKKFAPVDRGRLRASITPEVVFRGQVFQGTVGSNLLYAPFHELGVSTPFTPPWRPLFEWAMRKTKGNVIKARLLAGSARKAISKRGIVALRYLQRALEKNTEKIFDLLGQTVAKIVEK